MQIGVGGGPCGSAGDEYDQLRQLLPHPSLGPHDPRTAVELAALVLIKDQGVPTAQAIDADRPYVQAYNGSGPLAAGYADRVIRRGVACASTIGRRQPCTKQVVGVPVPCG